MDPMRREFIKGKKKKKKILKRLDYTCRQLEENLGFYVRMMMGIPVVKYDCTSCCRPPSNSHN